VPDPKPPPRLLIGELLIRRWRLSDAQPLEQAVSESHEELRQWLGWANEERGAQAAFLAATALAWDRGERFEYVVESLAGELLGSVGLMRRIGPGGLEIGYWVHSSHTGRGIAKLAAAKLSSAAFELPWVDHVEIHHDKANLRSGAVPSGLGFELVEEIDKERLGRSDSGRDLIWRLRREEFAASAASTLLAGS
jgi:RimJ/RimL family protein N-acetyltransferase